ncbi:MAG: hypothetical protein ACK5L3_03485 [Oscillospiraceae bacterium]
MNPVSKSDIPLVMDTLPALKTCRYFGEMPGGNIYSFARFYVFKKQLSVSLCVFERTPPPESRISFAIGGGAAQYLLVTLSPKNTQPAAARLCPEAGFGPFPPPAGSTRAAPPEAQYFAGEDEQGWYWGANLLLEETLLRQAGCPLMLGSQFYAAVFKHFEGSPAFGSSAPAVSNQSPLLLRRTTFEVVGY